MPKVYFFADMKPSGGLDLLTKKSPHDARGQRFNLTDAAGTYVMTVRAQTREEAALFGRKETGRVLFCKS